MLARERGELPEAERTAREVIARTERTGMRLVQRLAILLLTRALISDGRRAEAFETLGGYDGWGAGDATEYMAARFALELGTSSPASRLLSRGGSGTADQLLTARVHLHDGYADAASKALQPIEQRPLSIRQSIDHALLRALSAPASNEVAAAEWLGRAIALAEPERFVRVFSDEGAEMFDLLHSVSPEVDRTYLWNIYEAFDSVPLPRPAALLEPLSRRERAILRYLPTRLHNAEIGRELYVSHNTVKTHVRAIYRKLGVNSRWGAVERARELHLL
jgi:LuxR family maltose regulon positive regulatory protein